MHAFTKKVYSSTEKFFIHTNTNALRETFPPFSSTSLLLSNNSIILSGYHWHDLRLKTKHTGTDRKIQHAYKKECTETQKPKLYEHTMQIDKYGFTISIKV